MNQNTIVFIDPSVANYQALAADVWSKSEVVILDGQQDGIEQITKFLNTKENISAIHLICHGKAANLSLGKKNLNLLNLGEYQQQLASWSRCFAPEGASLLIYGCQVAATELGERLIIQLQDLTGAKVAASKTLTGSSQQGGNWQLEFTTAELTTPIIFSEALQKSYAGVFATFTVDTLEDEDNGINEGDVSLRDAIAAANETEEADTIEFDSSLRDGTITLSNGDLRITTSMELNGLGADNLTIDANQESRIFTIDDGRGPAVDVTIDGFKIMGGSVVVDAEGSDRKGGGGIYSNENTIIRNSLIVENELTWNTNLRNEAKGAGILNTGTMLVENTQISNNFSSGWAGGITNRNNLIVKNVLISDNRSGNIGAIENTGNLEVYNSTIFNNNSASSGAIRSLASAANEVLIVNTTITGNIGTGGGGLMFNHPNVRVINSTITENQSQPGQGGGIYAIDFAVRDNPEIEIINSIVSGNVNSDIDVSPGLEANFISGGGNIIGTGTAIDTFTAEGDQVEVTDPGLEELGDYGGPTPTHNLKRNSPAIDNGNNDQLPDDTQDLNGNGNTEEPLPVDQRYFPRVTGSSVDSGAVEFLSYIRGNNRDNSLEGTRSADLIDGRGGNDTITGRGGDDTLDGGRDNDIIEGGSGADELLGGRGDDTLRGDSRKDTLSGGSGDDLLVGGTGKDRLSGGSGSDGFLFNSPEEGVDRITDFNVDRDQIIVSARGFGGDLSANKDLQRKQFVIGSEATRSSQRFIFDSDNGNLFFDVDGSGSEEQVQIARLSNGVVLSNENIFVS